MIVQGEALFRGNAPAPTNSHLIRTVITEARRGRSIFSWQLEPQSVQSGGKLWRSSHSRAAAGCQGSSLHLYQSQNVYGLDFRLHLHFTSPDPCKTL